MTRVDPTVDTKRAYVALYGDRNCIVTGQPHDAMVDWSHLDDNRSHSSFLNLLRLSSGLNGAYEKIYVSRHDAPPELQPLFLLHQSYESARQGKFGAALGCARLLSYVACPQLRQRRKNTDAPRGDLRLGLEGSTRAIANARVLGRPDVARDILKRDVLPLMLRNNGDVRAHHVSGVLRQVGGFFRDAGEIALDQDLSEIVDALERLDGTRISESVGLRNSAIRDILLSPNSAAESLSIALELALDAGGTEPRAQQIWLARAEAERGDLDKSNHLIRVADKGAGAPISPDLRDFGYRRGSPLGSLTWQSMIEGLLIKANNLRQRGGKTAKQAAAYYEATYFAMLESGATPTGALGDRVLRPFHEWCEMEHANPPIRKKPDYYFHHWVRRLVAEINKQFGAT